ncbi:hypothetical protein, partial [Pectobacterium versatile]
ETQSGDITINTGTLTNQREGLVVTETALSIDKKPSWLGATRVNIPTSWFKNSDYGIYTTVTTVSLGSGGGGSDGEGGRERTSYSYEYAPYESSTIQKILTNSKDIEINVEGSTGKISSGNNVLINANKLENSASQLLSKNDLLLKGSELNNQSYQAGILNEYLTYRYAGGKKLTTQNNTRPSSDIYVSPYMLYVLDASPTYEKTVGESYNALIQAGGTITADF